VHPIHFRKNLKYEAHRNFHRCLVRCIGHQALKTHCETMIVVPSYGLSRRAVCVGGCLLLAGCMTAPQSPFSGVQQGADPYASIYGPVMDGPNAIPALELDLAANRDLLRQEVTFPSRYSPGTVVVNVSERRLYLVQRGSRALRYAVGVGREEALNFRGSAVIGQKAEWPRWIPTADMIKRIPRYAAYAAGMPGGLDNPLGARALYLYVGTRDTYFRIHGTNEPMTIGNAVSSGCIRLFNQDIIDLYNRVPLGAPVVVL
jgi:lipoprotein-anchoring transpeptidase ErfK/SrfK